MNELLDSLLTFIEGREAEQIRYGLYDVVMTGTEVLDAYLLAPEQDIRTALTTLWQRSLIIRLEENADHRDWRIRSRTAETVRLVSKLRQRVVGSLYEQQTHRADRSPRLVHDIKFELHPRQVPNRNLPIASLVSSMRPAHPDAATVLEVLFPSPDFQFSGFQQRAFEAIADHILIRPQHGHVRGLVVTASTGAGKTYAFFLPVLAYCIAEKRLHARLGVKAICLYPRVALSEKQLEDFVRLIYQVNQHLPPEHAITVGIDSGASPYRLSDFEQTDSQSLQQIRGWRWEADAARYVCPFARCPACDGELAVQQTQPKRIACIACGRDHPFILYAKEQFHSTPPDVLVATTESLNDRLMDSSFQTLFGNARFPPPAMIMLDEIHLQSSTKGTQIAFLLRRLVARIRRGGEAHSPRRNLMLIGLSATIAQPKAFFSDLTGLTSSVITEVTPDEDSEMVTAGAEHYLFIRAGQEEDTAVISTLLQTAMAVVHTMPLPSPEEQDAGIIKYKTFGFAQSLDIVGRWYYQLMDAEKMNRDNQDARARLPPERWPIEHTPLYWYRAPGHNRRLFPHFFGRGFASTACSCPQQGYPDLSCIFFQEGECWWTLGQGLQEPMRIKRKTASDRQTRIETDDDLIITTTALEVGYDDSTLMGIIQYQAPSNVASFVQRKGRGGRKVGTRPFITTVLSPYKTSDVFLYQNHHLLVEPRFKKLPLNPANTFLQRIHGFYALFDLLAYLAERQGLQLALGNYMGLTDYDTLKQLTCRQDVLDAYREYLSDAFDLDDPTRLQDLLVNPGAQSWNDYGILTRGLSGLMEALHESFDGGPAHRVAARSEILRDYLPQRLFSDINLPELNVQYGHRREPAPEEVSLALNETIPGNVTFRGGGGSSWIAPPLGPGRTFVLEGAYTLSNERRHELAIDTDDVPRRISSLIQAQGRMPRMFAMIRPIAVQLQQFGDRDGSRWWLDRSAAPGRFIQTTPGQQAPTGPNICQVRHASGAYPLGFTSIQTRQAGRRFSFDARAGGPPYNDLARALFNRIDFASDADNGRLMQVRRVIIGSQYSLRLVGEDEPLEGVMTFARRETPGDLGAIGYEMRTEGITFQMSELLADLGGASLPISDVTAARLRRNFTKHAVVTELMAHTDINYFAAERFAEAMLTVADLFVHNQQWSLDALSAACHVDRSELRNAFTWAVNEIYHLSRKNADAATRLFNQASVLHLFADRYLEMHTPSERYRHYLEDTFVHTLKHALKQTAQSLAGVEAMEYVSAYTRLNMDHGELSDRPIWLYERGMGGVGVLRSVQDVLRQNPTHFWQTLQTTIDACQTEAEDRFLLQVLSQPEAVLEALHALVGQVQTATSSMKRQEALRDLRDGLRKASGLLPHRLQIRLLVRLFSDDYTGAGIGLRNWRLYRELNAIWVAELARRLGRLPTATETRGLLYHALTHSNGQRRAAERTHYPELTRLLELYQGEYGGDEARRVFGNAISRRLLLNCRDACPTCLDEGPSCEIDPPGLSNLTLSRALVGQVLRAIRQPRTLTITMDQPAAALAGQIEALFQRDLISPVVVTAPADEPELLAALLSHLTDYGIGDRLERRYPRISQVRLVDGMLRAWLTLEGEV